MIVIAGATGRLGSLVAAKLEKAGVKQRLIVRDTARAPLLKNAETYVVSSYGDAPAMKKALSGVETLFLVSARDRMGVNQQAAQKGITAPPYDRVNEQTAAINTAAEAGVKHIIYLSFMGAAENAVFVLSREHYRTERYIIQSGIPFTFLRPCLYMENVPLRVSPEGVIRAPSGNGKAAWVTREDIADTAVAVLTGKGHEGHTYDVTGPEALTMAETAEIISRISGKKVKYISQTPEEAMKLHNASGMAEFEKERRRLTGKGLDEDEVEIWVTHYTQIAAGALGAVSDTVRKLTGRKAQSLVEYLSLHPESCCHIHS